jgi:hypothetical protein
MNLTKNCKHDYLQIQSIAWSPNVNELFYMSIICQLHILKVTKNTFENVQILLLIICALNITKFLEDLSWKHNMPQIRLGVEGSCHDNVIVTQIVQNQGVLT